jgi:hypothetical protein
MYGGDCVVDLKIKTLKSDVHVDVVYMELQVRRHKE